MNEEIALGSADGALRDAYFAAVESVAEAIMEDRACADEASRFGSVEGRIDGSTWIANQARFVALVSPNRNAYGFEVTSLDGLSEHDREWLIAYYAMRSDVNGALDRKLRESTRVRDAYEDGECPDCGEVVPVNAAFGEACSRCGHIWNEPE